MSVSTFTIPGVEGCFTADETARQIDCHPNAVRRAAARARDAGRDSFIVKGVRLGLIVPPPPTPPEPATPIVMPKPTYVPSRKVLLS